jgi:hypothetical protein
VTKTYHQFSEALKQRVVADIEAGQLSLREAARDQGSFTPAPQQHSATRQVESRQLIFGRPVSTGESCVGGIAHSSLVAALASGLQFSLLADASQAQSSLTIDTRSRIEIRDQGSPETDFSRLVAVHRLADGRLLTVTSAPAAIRLFDAQGRFVKTVAREGAGPNEIQGALVASVLALDLWVYDGSHLIRFDLGSLSEAQRIPFASGATSSAYAVLPEGRVLQARFAPPSTFDPTKAELLRTDLGFRIVSARDRAIFADLGTIAGRTFLRIPSQSAQSGFRTSMTRFAPQLYVASAGGVIWLGDSGTAWLKRIDTRTLRRDSIRVPFVAQQWSQAEIAAERARLIKAVQPPSERELPLAELDPMWRGERPPFYAQLHADYNGGLLDRSLHGEPDSAPVCDGA